MGLGSMFHDYAVRGKPAQVAQLRHPRYVRFRVKRAVEAKAK
jgi:hypothetical protein